MRIRIALVCALFLALNTCLHGARKRVRLSQFQDFQSLASDATADVNITRDDEANPQANDWQTQWEEQERVANEESIQNFRKADSNTDYFVTRAEFYSYTGQYRWPLQMSKAVFDFADTNFDNVLSQEEWVTVARKQRHGDPAFSRAMEEAASGMHEEQFDEETIKAFKAIDSNGDNYVTRVEFHNYASHTETRPIMLDAIFNYSDHNTDNILTQEDFENLEG